MHAVILKPSKPNEMHVHACFVQVTTCGAPDALTRLGARTFLLLSHLLGSQNKYQEESARTEVGQRVGSTKQVSKLSLGRNKHGQNVTTPHPPGMWMATFKASHSFNSSIFMIKFTILPQILLHDAPHPAFYHEILSSTVQ